jgi:hypothetical protein
MSDPEESTGEKPEQNAASDRQDQLRALIRRQDAQEQSTKAQFPGAKPDKPAEEISQTAPELPQGYNQVKISEGQHLPQATSITRRGFPLPALITVMIIAAVAIAWGLWFLLQSAHAPHNLRAKASLAAAQTGVKAR